MREEGWITKAEAAAILKCDERTIERRARAGRLNTRARPGFPTLYLQAQVEVLAQTTNQEVRTGLLETVPAASSNGNGAVAHRRDGSVSLEGLLTQVLHALLGALTPGATGPTGPTGGPTGPTRDLWMTPFAVARAWAWPRRVVLKLVEEGKLGEVFYIGTLARPRAVVRRSAVEAFAVGRKDLEQL